MKNEPTRPITRSNSGIYFLFTPRFLATSASAIIKATMPNGCQTVAVDKNSIDKNSIDKNRIEENREEKESTPKTKSKHTSKRFIKPTIEEIKEYCAQNDLKIDCERFYDYYESNDWHVGNNKMKSWKATARNWNRNNYSNRNNKNASNSPICKDNKKVYEDECYKHDPIIQNFLNGTDK